MKRLKDMLLEKLDTDNVILESLFKEIEKLHLGKAWNEISNIFKAAGFIEIPDYEDQSARLGDYIDYFENAKAKAFINNEWTILVANTQKHPISEDNPVFFIHRYDDGSRDYGKVWGKNNNDAERLPSKQFKEDMKRTLSK